MTWRSAVHGGFKRLTGYELTRENGRAAPSAPPCPADYDDEAQAFIADVAPYTTTSAERLHALILATRYVHCHGIPGDFVECGVRHGGSMRAVVATLLSMGDTERELFLFHRTAEPASSPAEDPPGDEPPTAPASPQDVISAFHRLPYPEERIHHIRDRLDATVSRAPERIAVLRVNTGRYATTGHALTHLYPRLVSGGVLLLDGYGGRPGARQAVDEFLEKTGARLLLLRTDEGRVAVKP